LHSSQQLHCIPITHAALNCAPCQMLLLLLLSHSSHLLHSPPPQSTSVSLPSLRLLLHCPDTASSITSLCEQQQQHQQQPQRETQAATNFLPVPGSMFCYSIQLLAIQRSLPFKMSEQGGNLRHPATHTACACVQYHAALLLSPTAVSKYV
jgi:hypothetical protein